MRPARVLVCLVANTFNAYRIVRDPIGVVVAVVAGDVELLVLATRSIDKGGANRPALKGRCIAVRPSVPSEVHPFDTTRGTDMDVAVLGRAEVTAVTLFPGHSDLRVASRVAHRDLGGREDILVDGAVGFAVKWQVGLILGIGQTLARSTAVGTVLVDRLCIAAGIEPVDVVVVAGGIVVRVTATALVVTGLVAVAGITGIAT